MRSMRRRKSVCERERERGGSLKADAKGMVSDPDELEVMLCI